MWFISWVFKLSILLYALSLLEQENGFSPVWILSCFIRIATCFKCLATLIAEKWLLSCVDPFISPHIPFLCKCLATSRTGKWLLACVYPFMSPQIPFLCKCLATSRTGKRLLTFVDPFMSPQIPYLKKPNLEQVNGFLPFQILLWFFKSLPHPNSLSNSEQVDGFSPVCVLSCNFNLPFFLNA